MTDYRFRLLNVFTIAGNPFSGNPLCVFEDGRGLSTATMQALALQFNLSETTFILPSVTADAHVRIFTPTFEMSFAGHPTLGTAHVVRSLHTRTDTLTLEMKAGLIPVTARGNTWTLTANTPTSRPVEANRAQLAEMLGLEPGDVDERPLWINTGSEQLIIPLNSIDAVARCNPIAHLLARYGRNADRYLAYVWAPGDGVEVCARFFFQKGTSVAEDPATGSACANLGGWFLATGAGVPLSRRIRQGDAVGRPSLLGLDVGADKSIQVSGEVIEFGVGTVRL